MSALNQNDQFCMFGFEPETAEQNIEIPIWLSDEQKDFIRTALEGNNILVDACIGSGKTTAIQQLCNVLPNNKRILYLTYNRLLKIDARAKIKAANVTVTNYHGFAYSMLRRLGMHTGVSDLILEFNRVKPPIGKYDVLILDEYQDIMQEFAEMLEYITSANSGIQIIAVGDMEQKIYDMTSLNVPEFIDSFLGEYKTITFTKCFRLSAGIAGFLSRVWDKPIIGVNNSCSVEKMRFDEAVDFLSTQNPEDVLCLGSRTGDMPRALNTLESLYPERYNKKTTFASISNSDNTTSPNKKSAIFTTYDSSKGLERKICVVFDFTESYWQTRINKPEQSYQILRNIFCVAASRGKYKIIFVSELLDFLSEETLSADMCRKIQTGNMDIRGMFDFKYRENIEQCYSMLNINEKPLPDHNSIYIRANDNLIDLSPCIQTYQKAIYFTDFQINKYVDMFFQMNPDKYKSKGEYRRLQILEEQVLYFTSLSTVQERYWTQVDIPFVTETARNSIIQRLSSKFSPNESVQVECSIDFEDSNGNLMFSALGLADVVKNDIEYELEFVSELSHEHFLQCACYMIALGLKKCVLWNTQKNLEFEIRVPDKQKFLDAVISAITKNKHTKYYGPSVN